MPLSIDQFQEAQKIMMVQASSLVIEKDVVLLQHQIELLCEASGLNNATVFCALQTVLYGLVKRHIAAVNNGPVSSN